MKINTLYELLRHGVEKFASRTAFDMFNGESVTYAEVGRRAAAVQEALVGAGVKAGDKVALLSSSMPNWGICYLAVTSAGMVAVPILPDFSGPELDMIIAHSEAKALLVSDKLFSKLSKQTIDSLNIVIRTKNLGIIAQHVTATGSTAVPSPDDLAAIIFSQRADGSILRLSIRLFSRANTEVELNNTTKHNPITFFINYYSFTMPHGRIFCPLIPVKSSPRSFRALSAI